MPRSCCPPRLREEKERSGAARNRGSKRTRLSHCRHGTPEPGSRNRGANRTTERHCDATREDRECDWTAGHALETGARLIDLLRYWSTVTIWTRSSRPSSFSAARISSICCCETPPGGSTKT